MFSRPLIAKTRVLLILLTALIFTGCGQKGALFLPDEEATGASMQYTHGKFLI